ncbi:MAG TPA: hypothetical protein VFR33_08230 [Candidatus Dormibacteraeota bacterium]|nr:hypothetical protein [Candidatus Dormibacteraeota bacterium]
MSYIQPPGVVGDPYYGGAAYADYDYEPNGWLVFAGLMMFFTGMWNIFEGLIALFRSSYFSGSPIFGNLVLWSSVWIGIGVLEMSAAYAIFSGRSWARWFGLVLVSISAIVHMASIPIYPWWSLMVVAFDALMIYALAVRWPSRQAVTAAG